MLLLEQLEKIQLHFLELSHLIADPQAMTDMKKYIAINKEYKELEPIIDLYRQYKKMRANLEDAQLMQQSEKDPEMLEMAKEESKKLSEKLPLLEEEIKALLIPKDPEDDKNAIMELRAGTGGDEACIFVEDIWRMYSMFFKEMGWKYEILNLADASHGIKEIIVQIEGQDVYGWLKYESGVHRVQRVPETESMGRVHTSAITVAILPEIEEIDFHLDMNEVKKDTFRASGAGGQHINKTESAIRLTHLPTGMVVECQDGRSQHKNFEQATKVLRYRLYEQEMQKRHQERADKRKLLVSTGDRSAKIRTYNYPQGRITDHRINLTMYSLDAFMNGKIQDMMKGLKMADNAEKMNESQA